MSCRLWTRIQLSVYPYIYKSHISKQDFVLNHLNVPDNMSFYLFVASVNRKHRCSYRRCVSQAMVAIASRIEVPISRWCVGGTTKARGTKSATSLRMMLLHQSTWKNKFADKSYSSLYPNKLVFLFSSSPYSHVSHMLKNAILLGSIWA